MWVVADLDDDYIARMEDVLEVYERPYDSQQPGQPTNPRSQNATPGGESLKLPHEPRPRQDRLEVRPQSHAAQVPLSRTIFQAVRDLVITVLESNILL
jgi:hypothetical protein